jgi:hypothetical protein
MNEAKIQISFIRDDPGLVIRADTAEEAEALLSSSLPIYKRFRDVVDKGKVNKANNEAKAVGMPSAICKDCQAQMVFKTGTSKTGKSWSGLFCPNSDKNDKSKHVPIWL